MYLWALLISLLLLSFRLLSLDADFNFLICPDVRGRHNQLVKKYERESLNNY